MNLRQDDRLTLLDGQLSSSSNENEENEGFFGSSHHSNASVCNGMSNLQMEGSSQSEAPYKPGSLHQISNMYESLDYDPCLNSLWIDEQRRKSYKTMLVADLLRWLVVLFIGFLTALVACGIDVSIQFLSSYKFSWLQRETEKCALNGCLYWPYLMWVALNAGPVLVAALFGSCIEPVSAGSGIPQVKCYLNGVKVPRIVRIKTLLSKVVGVVFSVVGGLAVGKEGPMIHSGAVIAAGISQGKTTTFNYDFHVLNAFRSDHEKRDFVSAGAAAGVAAAFGAPIGGVLFSLEEGASFWNQSLTWRVFFSALVSYFTLNFTLSAVKGSIGDMNSPGLINFGKFDDLTYHLYEFVAFSIMGAMGGFLGAMFNHLNYLLSVLRIKYINRPFSKVIEAMLVASVTASFGFLMIYSIRDCRDIDTEKGGHPVQLFCKEGEESTSAVLLFSTPEECVRSLFHDPKGAYEWTTVSVFFVVYYALACMTYGLGVPSGLFVPSLLVGASWGRMCGMLMTSLFPNQAWVDEGKYALVGAAAMLGGVVRMTISLTVILMECVGNNSFGLPLMIVVMISKWVGDFFNEGLYDIHIQLSGAPFMPWEPPHLTDCIFASEVMNRPVVTLRSVESVSRILHVLKSRPHNGFPVVDRTQPEARSDAKEFGKLRGLILRSQLLVLLKHKVFNENARIWAGDGVNLQLFRASYPRFHTLQDVNLSPEDLSSTVDLRPFMNPSPYALTSSASLQRIFRLFRALGLRHIVILNDANCVVGIVTRKDLVKFRLFHHSQGVSLRQLDIYSQS